VVDPSDPTCCQVPHCPNTLTGNATGSAIPAIIGQYNGFDGSQIGEKVYLLFATSSYRCHISY